MTGLIKKTVLGATLAASTLVAVAPAEAQYYRGYRHHRGGGDVAAGAVLGGIVGLGLGAAIASSNNRGRYYDRGYYNDGYYRRGYYDDRGYYYDRPRVVYRERYYAPPPRVIYRDRYYGGYPRGGYYGY